jgi:hypothetical protein
LRALDHIELRARTVTQKFWINETSRRIQFDLLAWMRLYRILPVGALFVQLHSSLNGGSLPHGGMDELMPLAPPLDGDTPLEADPLLDVGARFDP